MVLLLFGAAWFATRDRDWHMRRAPRGYATMMVVGAALAVTVQWIAVHVIHKWAYAQAMPRIPGVEIGLVPVLEMIALPPLVIRIAVTLNRRWEILEERTTSL